jgi:hypothetical protein
MRVCLGFGIVMLAATTADAGTVCTYGSSYNDPGIGGVCFIDAVAGCPVHVVLPHPASPAELMPLVLRDGQTVTVTSSSAVVASQNAEVENIDYYSCDCARTTVSMQFDDIALTINGARAGDIVDIGGAQITIAAAGACSPPAWPTEFDVQFGGCDPCPMPPPGSSSGCGATTGGSFACGLLVVWVAARSRRRR